jgi:hypothetical protein
MNIKLKFRLHNLELSLPPKKNLELSPLVKFSGWFIVRIFHMYFDLKSPHFVLFVYLFEHMLATTPNNKINKVILNLNLVMNKIMFKLLRVFFHLWFSMNLWISRLMRQEEIALILNQNFKKKTPNITKIIFKLSEKKKILC